MATTKSTTTRSRTAKPRASRPENKSLAARTGRTIKERPYTSAAIATGAVTAVAAAAAGAFFFSRRDKSLRESSDELTAKVKGSFADAREKIRDLVSSDEGRSQQEIAEEALTLKETGRSAASPVDDLTGAQIKAGSVAY
ncbi:MAG: hypothetical protein M3Q83_03965 [Pseudomonadota bacterium]|nr:hypothetical protein [Pseudomonadota bacterium]